MARKSSSAEASRPMFGSMRANDGLPESRVASPLSQQARTFGDALRSFVESADEQMASERAQLVRQSELLATWFRQQVETITSANRLDMAALAQRLAAAEASAAEMRHLLEDTLGGLATRCDELQRRVSTLGSTLGALTERDDDLASRVRRIDERIAAVADRLDANIAEGLDAKMAEAISGLDERLSTAVSGLDARVAQTVGGLDARMTSVSSGVDARVAEAVAGLDSRLSEALSGIDERLSGSLSGIDAKLAEAVDEKVAGAVNELDAKVSGAIDELGEQLTGTISELDEKVISAVGEATLARIESDRLSAGIGERLDAIAVRMNEVESQLSDTMDVSAAVQLDRLDELERAVAELDPDQFMLRTVPDDAAEDRRSGADEWHS